jgi:hypothetical protein
MMTLILESKQMMILANNDMGMDSSVADQASVQGGMSQGVSGQENSQGSASYGMKPIQ